jgi:hypothetical protein
MATILQDPVRVRDPSAGHAFPEPSGATERPNRTRTLAEEIRDVNRLREMEALRMAEVDTLVTVGTARTRSTQRAALRGLLGEATRAESLDVNGLQRLVRERITSKRRLGA